MLQAYDLRRQRGRRRAGVSHLATLTSAAENAFIVTNLSSALGTSNTYGYWFGLFGNDASTYQWVTGEPFSFTNWNAGEPNK